MTPKQKAETTKAWIHWVKKNPIDQNQLDLALGIESLVEQAFAEEREACIRAIEESRPDWHDTGDGLTDEHNGGLDAAIEAIRARK